MNPRFAPGSPGRPLDWNPSAKEAVGTAFGPTSRVWFTIGHGALNEAFYPQTDQACIRDLRLVVTDGKQYFSDEMHDAKAEVFWLEDGVPAFRVVTTSQDQRYRIEKLIFAHPRRNSLLQQTVFVPLSGSLADYHLSALVTPHLENHGSDNTASVGAYKATPLLLAERKASALALGCSAGWRTRSAGYVGQSDGLSDLRHHKRLESIYERAERGSVALTGEIDLEACGGEFLLVLGFGGTTDEAGHQVVACLREDFDELLDAYRGAWREWQRTLTAPTAGTPLRRKLFRASAAVLMTHESKRLPGAIIASLSTPWGMAKFAGYHVVWPRDLVETAGALLALGANDDVRRVLNYLFATQERDGYWPQNMWVDGIGHWHGIQMDETALPILAADLARRNDALTGHDLARLWPMIERAAQYIQRNGPTSQQDRWETDSGYSIFTVATEIAALLAAADLAEQQRREDFAASLRETADRWYASLDDWLYVRDSELAHRFGVEGYYIRNAPQAEDHPGADWNAPVKWTNAGHELPPLPANAVLSPDALALVRFGLRSADDPRIRNTVRVIDAMLRIETPRGPVWHRYSGDTYGEQDDGSPPQDRGWGRGWPLLVGERGHFELAAGNRGGARELLEVLERLASETFLISEQVWDADAIPAKGLFPGRPTSSAMPLVWAHAEYLKLLRSLHDGAVFDLPPQTVERYLRKPPSPSGDGEGAALPVSTREPERVEPCKSLPARS